LLYDAFLELLHPVDSPHVTRQWDRPIETFVSMKRQYLNWLSHAESGELNRQLKDAIEAGLIRLTHSEFGLPTLFVGTGDGSLPLYIDCRGLKEFTRKDTYPLSCVDDALDELKDASFYTHVDLARLHASSSS
jgi:hypothetical protein